MIFLKVYAHENLALLMQSNIQSFPTVLLLLNGVVRYAVEYASQTPGLVETKIIDYKQLLLESGLGADLGTISIAAKLVYPSKRGGYGTGNIEEEYLVINPREGLQLLYAQILSLTDIAVEMQVLRDSRGVDIKTDAELDAALCRRRENVITCHDRSRTIDSKVVEASSRPCPPPLPCSRLSTCTRVIFGKEPLLQPATVVMISGKSEGHNKRRTYLLCSYCGERCFPPNSPLVYAVGIVANFSCASIEALNAGVREVDDIFLSPNDEKHERLQAITTLYNVFPCHEMEDSKVQFVATLDNYSKMAYRYGDPELQAAARSIIPHEILSCKDDFSRITSLLQWFKKTFKFVTKPQCMNCGEDRCMEALGMTKPTYEEVKAGEANRVELYKCMNCGSEWRFPRYNNPGMILKTQYGR